jgi:hypothetical protein
MNDELSCSKLLNLLALAFAEAMAKAARIYQAE